MRRGVSKKIGEIHYTCFVCLAHTMRADTFWIGNKTVCALHHGELTDGPRQRFRLGTPLLVTENKNLAQVIGDDGDSLTLAVYFGDHAPELMSISRKDGEWWEVDDPLRADFHARKTYAMLPGQGLVGKTRRRKLSKGLILVRRQTSDEYKSFRKLETTWRWWFREGAVELPSIRSGETPVATDPPVSPTPTRKKTVAALPCPVCRVQIRHGKCKCPSDLCPKCGKSKRIMCECPRPQARIACVLPLADRLKPVCLLPRTTMIDARRIAFRINSKIPDLVQKGGGYRVLTSMNDPQRTLYLSLARPSC